MMLNRHPIHKSIWEKAHVMNILHGTEPFSHLPFHKYWHGQIVNISLVDPTFLDTKWDGENLYIKEIQE